MIISRRRTLPSRRECDTFDLRHGDKGPAFRVSVSYFPGTAEPAEVFVTGAKAGSETEAIARDGAILLSLAMQYGIPLDAIRSAVTREQGGEPSTIIGSVVDGLGRG